MSLKRETVFVFLFSSLFTAFAWAVHYLDNLVFDLNTQLLVFPIFFVGLAGLRILTRIVEHAQESGSRKLGWLIGRYTRAQETPPEQLSPSPHEPESFLQMLVNLVFVGGTIALGISLIPFLILFEAMSLFGELPEDNRWINGFFLTGGSLITYAWFVFLERTAGLRILLPLVPIRAVWLMPLVFIGGLTWFAFPGVFK